MAHLDYVIRHTKRTLDLLARGAPADAGAIPGSGDVAAADPSPVSGIDIGDDPDHQGQLPQPAQG